MAPFDAVVASKAYSTVPPPLVEQLRRGGRLVQPIGTGGAEEVRLFERTDDELADRGLIVSAQFVRLHGLHGYP